MAKEKVKVTSELASYVPRHIRLGLPKNVEPVFSEHHDVEEEIPILDQENRMVSSVSKHVLYEPKDTIGRFKASDFDIDVLQAAGVPLDIVNIRTPGMNMAQVANAVSKLSSLEEMTQFVQQQNEEYSKFFNNNVEPNKE